MSGEPIAITGANGHLGRRLLSLLAERGAPAIGLVRSERAAQTVRETRADAQVHIVDYASPASLAPALEGARGVIHLVGILKEGSTSSYEVAHEGTCTALAAAAASSGLRRIVYLSIVGSEPGSSNPCLASKGRGEEILCRGKVPASVLRVPMVLGRGELAAHALAARARTPRCLLIGGGRSLEQPIDADDVARAVLAALDESGPSLRHDLAGPECLPYRELVERAAALLGTSPRIVAVPLGPIRLLAGALERLLADPPITRAMLDVLQHDDRVDPEPACKALGLELTALEATLRRALEVDA